MTDHAIQILLDSFGRIDEAVPGVLEGLDHRELAWRPDAGANPIGWLVWHLTRVQDDHVAGLDGSQQVWVADQWHQRLDLGYAVEAIGYGQSAEDVAAFGEPDPALLQGYFSAVHARTVEVLTAMVPQDLDRVLDDSWDPPVTVAIRLVSVVNDMSQHIGQASYLRGLVQRRTR